MITQGRSSVQRRQGGQALAESAAGVVIFAFLFVVITPFVVNFFYFTSYYGRLEQVAAESAKAYETNIARGQDPTTAGNNATTLANTLATAIALPTANLSISFSDQTTYVVCTAGDSIVPPCLSTAFGNLFDMTARGVGVSCGPVGGGGTSGNIAGYWELNVAGACALVPIAAIVPTNPDGTALTSYNNTACFGACYYDQNSNGVDNSGTTLNAMGGNVPAGTTMGVP
jgi:hypothetical protein